MAALGARGGIRPLSADTTTITAQLSRLDDLLRRDVVRANTFFRTHVAPITCTLVREGGGVFYRASVVANGSEIIKSQGLAQAFDFGGCEGPQSPAGEQVAGVPFPSDGVMRRLFAWRARPSGTISVIGRAAPGDGPGICWAGGY